MIKPPPIWWGLFALVQKESSIELGEDRKEGNLL